jgi:HAE1 family hydrophobic/amphiphilic exporter-1
MTAFSSILGFLSLLVAAGAGAASRQAVGNAVVGGMIAATLFSLLFVPAFFVVFRRLGELGQKRTEPATTDSSVEMKPEPLEDKLDEPEKDEPENDELGESEQDDRE